MSTPVRRSRTAVAHSYSSCMRRVFWFSPRLAPLVAGFLASISVVSAAPAQAPARQQPRTADARVGLRGGWNDAQEASSNMRLIAHRNRPEGFVNPRDVGDFGLINSDLAFSGSRVFIGGYHGWQVWDVSTPSAPVLQASFACPGGQGDVSVYRNLLFLSVEESSARKDCGAQGVDKAVSSERFMGVRIFDIADIQQPRRVAQVQTCRGSHTHTLLVDPRDSANAYIYVSGTNSPRSGTELSGCSSGTRGRDTATALYRIDVIKVPLSEPQNAAIVSRPRLFADRTGTDISALWDGGSHGPNTQSTAETDQCHDITVYPEWRRAAGACSGNGILLDISDPAHPVRLHEVVDPNFAYWHGATFNNVGDKVVFSDEWGGGAGAKCRASDRMTWGANALFSIERDRMRLRGHYKMPAPQASTENCVAHNGNLIPVPGRDIMVQAWYQGGISVFDFSDPTRPVEIAWFDRGPIDPNALVLAGFWSAYWHNGYIYGSEIGRGLDVLELVPSAHLSQNEIDAAKLIQWGDHNPQMQTFVAWPASFVVARAYLDQMERGRDMPAAWIADIRSQLARAESASHDARAPLLVKLATQLDKTAARGGVKKRLEQLTANVGGMAHSAH
jgi:hypothetical protein